MQQPLRILRLFFFFFFLAGASTFKVLELNPQILLLMHLDCLLRLANVAFYLEISGKGNFSHLPPLLKGGYNFERIPFFTRVLINVFDSIAYNSLFDGINLENG